MATKSEMEKQAEALANEEVLVETNAGTFGAGEAQRAVGTGDPAFAEYRIYERVGGGEPRKVGAEPETAPGYARPIGRDALAAKRAQLSQLRKAIANA